MERPLNVVTSYTTMPIKSISRRRGVGCPHRPVKLRKLQSWGDHSVTLSPSRQGRAQERMRSHVYKFKVLELECANRHIYIYMYIYIYVNNSSSQLLKIISFLFGYCNHLNAEILNANL